MKSIIQEMKDYLKEKNLSQKEFAALLGCSQAAISQWLNGNRTISTKFYITFKGLQEEKNLAKM